jgi:sortase A
MLRWTERLLVICGSIMLVWWLWLVSDAAIFQDAARRSLEHASRARHTTSDRLSVEPPRTSLGTATLTRGDAVAALSVPRVHLSAIVLHGSDAQTLRRGPGHIEHTALPGDSGNVVIAGHRDSFFRPLRDVQVGDDVFVDTFEGHFHYRVISRQVVNAHDLSVLEPTEAATLTLITCYPFWVLGPAPDRFIVRAARVVEPASAEAIVNVEVSLERTTTPADQPSVSTPDVRPMAAFPDDDVLVREAIERFRSTYNARLVARHDTRAGGPLTFQSCSVAFEGESAEATCEGPAASEGPPPRSTFRLERADDRWAIRELALQ